jgi:hypothetical protein
MSSSGGSAISGVGNCAWMGIILLVYGAHYRALVDVGESEPGELISAMHAALKVRAFTAIRLTLLPLLRSTGSQEGNVQSALPFFKDAVMSLMSELCVILSIFKEHLLLPPASSEGGANMDELYDITLCLAAFAELHPPFALSLCNSSVLSLPSTATAASSLSSTPGVSDTVPQEYLYHPSLVWLLEMSWSDARMMKGTMILLRTCCTPQLTVRINSVPVALSASGSSAEAVHHYLLTNPVPSMHGVSIWNFYLKNCILTFATKLRAHADGRHMRQQQQQHQPQVGILSSIMTVLYYIY